MQKSKFVDFDLKALSKIGRTWRGLPTLQQLAHTAFDAKGYPESQRDDFIDEFVDEHMPTVPLRMADILSHALQHGLDLSWPVKELERILQSESLLDDLKITEEMLEDADFLQVKFLVSDDKVIVDNLRGTNAQ